MCLYVCVLTTKHVHAEVKGQLVRVGSLFLTTYGFLGWNSGSQAWHHGHPASPIAVLKVRGIRELAVC